MWIFITLLVLCVVVGAIANANDNAKTKERDKALAEDRRRRRQAEQEEYDNALAEFDAKFGECTMNEKLGDWNEHNIKSRVLIYEQSSVIIINSKKYEFSDILGYSLVDDATSETITTSVGTAKTSTGSMIGRAVVGGVLTGGLGAVAGAATAKKEYLGQRHKSNYNYT